jgi:hypothetical protein
MHKRIPVVDSGVVFVIGIWMEVETAIGSGCVNVVMRLISCLRELWSRMSFPIYKRERGEKENTRYEENEKQRTLHKGKHVARV